MWFSIGTKLGNCPEGQNVQAHLSNSWIHYVNSVYRIMKCHLTAAGDQLPCGITQRVYCQRSDVTSPNTTAPTSTEAGTASINPLYHYGRLKRSVGLSKMQVNDSTEGYYRDVSPLTRCQLVRLASCPTWRSCPDLKPRAVDHKCNAYPTELCEPTLNTKI